MSPLYPLSLPGFGGICTMGLLALPQPLAPSNDVAIVFAPPAGGCVKKSFHSEIELQLTDSRWIWWGTELSGPDTAATSTEVRDLILEDEYLALDEARPRRLRRTFLKARSRETESWRHSWNGPLESRREGTSHLEDHAVLFAWDDSNDAFRVTCDGDRAVPDSLLEGLEEDTDLRGFLPQRRVSAGDTWRVGPEAYCRLYALGGAIPCAQIGGEDLTGVLEQPLFRALEGDLRVQLAGFEHADGTDVAVLEFRGDLKGRLESEGELGAILLGWGYPVEGEIQRMAELAIYVEGTLLWDAAEDRAISASLAGDVKLLREAIYTTAGSYRSESRERTSWEGTLRCELAVE